MLIDPLGTFSAKILPYGISVCLCNHFNFTVITSITILVITKKFYQLENHKCVAWWMETEGEPANFVENEYLILLLLYH